MRSCLIDRLLRAVYYLALPLTVLYLHKSQRARVLIVAEGQVLLLKNMHGQQHWSLPGGGIKKAEPAVRAAVREVLEETGLQLQPRQIKPLSQLSGPTTGWPLMQLYYFVAQLEIAPSLTRPRPYEIRSLEWFSLTSLPRACDSDVHQALDLAKLQWSVDPRQ